MSQERAALPLLDKTGKNENSFLAGKVYCEKNRESGKPTRAFQKSDQDRTEVGDRSEADVRQKLEEKRRRGTFTTKKVH